MFTNYFITALRNLLNQKFYALINIGGLAIALAACLLIMLFVRDEMSYDDWIPNAERIFKIETTIPLQGRDTLLMGQVPPAIAPALARYFPDEVEYTARVLQSESIVGADDRYFSETISFVDPDFLQVFELEMFNGDTGAMADGVNTILISESLAHKYFGDTPALDRVLTATVMRSNRIEDAKTEFRIAGVFHDLPANSHMPFTMFARLDAARFSGIDEEFGSAWMNAAYVRFREGTDPRAVEARMSEFYLNVAPPRGDESETFDYRTDRTLSFINVADVHLHSDKNQQLKPVGSFTTVVSFCIVALLILVIASINFVNLATARALRRAKEVSMRKVLGATRAQLVPQFLGEAVLTTVLALVIALFIAGLVLPYFNQYLGKNLVLGLLDNPLLIIAVMLVVVIIGILGGAYPAFFLSSFRPARVMGSNTSANKGSLGVRKALVLIQFAISIALIVATIIIHAQAHMLRSMDLGVALENRLVIRGITSRDVAPLADTLRQQMLAIPEVTAAAQASDELPLTHYNNSDFIIPALGVTEPIDTDRVFVDAHFFDLYGVQPLAGRLYGEEYTADTLVRSESDDEPWTRNAVVTESFTRTAGVNDLSEMLGKVIVAPDYGGEGIHLHATVISVIPDLHLRALHERTAQMVFFASSSVLDVMTLKLETDDLAATLAAIDDTWQDVVPQAPIQRYFAQDKFNALYETEQRRGQVLTALSVFAMFVACLGLFGLAAYSVEQKTLEIGIRKVHGARIADILVLIGAQLLKSVLWANLVAWPVAYFIMRDWLDSYAFRIDITPVVFITSGLVAALLALTCVIWQVLKVARSSPIHALRHE